MKTAKQLIGEVEAELNAVKAADMGMEAALAFAQEALNQFAAGDTLKTKEALDNLVGLLSALRPAIPANVVPASAGPVGKSPHEQYLEQARGIVESSLNHMQIAMKGVQETLGGINTAVNHAMTATAAINSPDLKEPT
jgi:hypothetical protein